MILTRKALLPIFNVTSEKKGTKTRKRISFIHSVTLVFWRSANTSSDVIASAEGSAFLTPPKLEIKCASP